MTRRKAIGKLAAATALAAISPVAFSQTGAPAPKAMSGVPDPRNRYPRPPFKRQMQPFPGLASKMDPLPDHGESSYVGTGKLQGRKALITGGDSGIGRAAAIAYAREGADVAINYLPAEESDAAEVIALIRKAGRKAVAIPGDIRDENFCKELVAKAVEQLGGLDILVNNAGHQKSVQSLTDLSTEEFDWTIKTNMYAPFWITRAALPHLKVGSSIISTSSTQAYNPSENLFDYSQTKAANVAFVKSLAKQLGPKGIRVNGVAPGPIWTALQICGGQTMDKVEKFGEETPLGRPGQPAELASVYVALASADSTYITGQIYGVSGGVGNP